MSQTMVEPTVVTSIYCSPNSSRSAARHLKNQKARRVRFAQHVRETLIDDGSWMSDSRNSSASKSTSSVRRKSENNDSSAGGTLSDESKAVAQISARHTHTGVGVIGYVSRSLSSVYERLRSLASAGLGRSRKSMSRRALFVIGLGIVSFIIFRVLMVGRRGAFASLAGSEVSKPSAAMKSVVRKKAVKAPLLKL